MRSRTSYEVSDSFLVSDPNGGTKDEPPTRCMIIIRVPQMLLAFQDSNTKVGETRTRYIVSRAFPYYQS